MFTNMVPLVQGGGAYWSRAGTVVNLAGRMVFSQTALRRTLVFTGIVWGNGGFKGKSNMGNAGLGCYMGSFPVGLLRASDMPLCVINFKELVLNPFVFPFPRFLTESCGSHTGKDCFRVEAAAKSLSEVNGFYFRKKLWAPGKKNASGKRPDARL